MARTSQVTQPMPLTGFGPTLTAPGVDGDVVDVGRCFLYVANGSGSPITVTVQTPGGVEDLALAERAVSVPASGFRMIPLTMSAYRQPVGSPDAGRAYVDYSAVTNITRGVISL
ncbi:hypothetical protein [Actinokineospora spheciospongiae]|uniref:hypothetical protein n=1 Tax=Actinokineospora spheciospongiae TaxID=909613 RepID=UPI000D71449A|nr:hypothetical protein [Actinokineospora spheciospongiae]PWW50265.1 hypothetical protein DFQ13_12327 [Actinokineospora spheciospongiae]